MRSYLEPRISMDVCAMTLAMRWGMIFILSMIHRSWYCV